MRRLAILLLALSAAASADGWTLEGRVTDSDMRPVHCKVHVVDDAHVYWREAGTAETDAAGAYRLHCTDPRGVTVYPEVVGRHGRVMYLGRQAITIGGTETRRLDIMLPQGTIAPR
ncbi:MAG TPA: hypothetical protein VGO93_09460 [Candidatus Xenobia bacterium]|jgi:hypothetical protein